MARCFLTFLGLSVICVFLQQITITSGRESDRQVTTIDYRDIPERVRIIGKLGQPLGQLVTVRGRWTRSFPSKPALPVFVVEQVDGRKLNPQAQFDALEPIQGNRGEVANRIVGEEWELRGVETGGFEGFSDEVWQELGQPPMQRPPRGFLTRFCYLRATHSAGNINRGRDDGAARKQHEQGK